MCVNVPLYNIESLFCTLALKEFTIPIQEENINTHCDSFTSKDQWHPLINDNNYSQTDSFFCGSIIYQNYFLKCPHNLSLHINHLNIYSVTHSKSGGMPPNACHCLALRVRHLELCTASGHCAPSGLVAMMNRAFEGLIWFIVCLTNRATAGFEESG